MQHYSTVSAVDTIQYYSTTIQVPLRRAEWDRYLTDTVQETWNLYKTPCGTVRSTVPTPVASVLRFKWVKMTGTRNMLCARKLMGHSAPPSWHQLQELREDEIAQAVEICRALDLCTDIGHVVLGIQMYENKFARCYLLLQICHTCQDMLHVLRGSILL